MVSECRIDSAQVKNPPLKEPGLIKKKHHSTTKINYSPEIKNGLKYCDVCMSKANIARRWWSPLESVASIESVNRSGAFGATIQIRIVLLIIALMMYHKCNNPGLTERHEKDKTRVDIRQLKIS